MMTNNIEQRIDELLAKMTLEEKAGQMNQLSASPVGGFEISAEDARLMLEEGSITQEQYDSIVTGESKRQAEELIRQGKAGSLIAMLDAKSINRLQHIAVEESRLGIPLLIALDVVHGLKTIFPIPLAEACSFDERCWETSARIAAQEAWEQGIRCTYAPMLDISRDARWGRCAEGPGEDPWLASQIARAKVRGYQGQDPSVSGRIAACAKHFAAYGACEGGRDYNTVDMSLPMLHEMYLPPFKAAVDAGCLAVMPAFNDLSGIPCTTNRYLLQDVLRTQYGFQGAVISDASAIGECVQHGTALDAEDAARQAAEAGVNIDLGADCYARYIPQLVESGKLDIRFVDEAVRCILRMKMALGLFEQPYTPEDKPVTQLCDSYREQARNIARRSMVLLKNTEQLLPLSGHEKIALVGDCAHNRGDMLGCWSALGESRDVITLHDALTQSGVSFRYGRCCAENRPLDEAELLDTIADADIVIAAVSYSSSGEASSRCNLMLCEGQKQMLRTIRRMGKKLITVLFNGRPIALSEELELSDALLEAWHPGTEAGNAVADVLLGHYNPSGRLAMSFPRHPADNPVYYNHPRTGRPASASRWTCKYTDVPAGALFPFGYGLSYTEYHYSDLQLEKLDDGFRASVTVANTGTMAGEETVQCYIHRRKAARVRPVRELKGICKVFLQPGESKRIEIAVPQKALAYYDVLMNECSETSLFDVWMAHDSVSGVHGLIEC